MQGLRACPSPASVLQHAMLSALLVVRNPTMVASVWPVCVSLHDCIVLVMCGFALWLTPSSPGMSVVLPVSARRRTRAVRIH